VVGYINEPHWSRVAQQKQHLQRFVNRVNYLPVIPHSGNLPFGRVDSL
jgi:hypothetical protein